MRGQVTTKQYSLQEPNKIKIRESAENRAQQTGWLSPGLDRTRNDAIRAAAALLSYQFPGKGLVSRSTRRDAILPIGPVTRERPPYPPPPFLFESESELELELVFELVFPPGLAPFPVLELVPEPLDPPPLPPLPLPGTSKAIGV